MPSSTVTACRASVMLGSMIVVPAAALFWPSFPSAVDSVWASVKPRSAGSDKQLTARGEYARQELALAPRFEPAAPRGPFDFAQQGVAPQTVASRQGFGLPTTAPPSGAPVQPLSAGERPHLIPVAAAQPSHPADTLAPASYEQPRSAPYPTSLREHRAISQDLGTAPRFDPAGTTETLQNVQAALRERGVTYSLLETWGPQGNQFRFHCKVAMAGNTRYSRHFEATDHDPLAAMRRVLDQVTAWQTGRSL